MPVPLSSAFFAAGFALLPLSEVAGAVLACVGLANQLMVSVSLMLRPPAEDYDGLG